VLVDVVVIEVVEVSELDEEDVVVVVVIGGAWPAPLSAPGWAFVVPFVSGGSARLRARAYGDDAGDASTKTAKESRMVTSEKMVRTRPAQVVERRIVGEIQRNVMSSKALDGFCRCRRRRRRR